MHTQTQIQVRPLLPFLGAEIEGVDTSKPISPDLLSQFQSAIAEHQLLVLRNQNLNVEQQITFGRNFGELAQILHLSV